MANFFKKIVGPAPEVITARGWARAQAEYFLSSARTYKAEGNINMARSQATEGLRIAKEAPGYLAVTDQLTDFLRALPTRHYRHHGRQPLAKAA